jgi:hypothetical protein
MELDANRFKVMGLAGELPAEFFFAGMVFGRRCSR